MNADTAELPEGWVSASVAEVTQYVANVKPETEPDREFGYVDISSICNQSNCIVETKPIFGKDAPSRARRPVQAGDVLFSNVRTYLRNVAIVTDHVRANLCSTGFTVLRPKRVIDARYLFRYVLTDGFIALTEETQTGTHYPATSDRAVMALPIPVPPLAEQRRIVAKVEALLARVNAARQRLAKVPAILKRFRHSVLAAACSGRLTADWRQQPGSANDVLERIHNERRERLRSASGRVAKLLDGVPKSVNTDWPGFPELPPEWVWCQTADLCQPERALTYGVIKLGPPVEDGVPTLRSSDVRHLYIDGANIKRIAKDIADEFARTYLRGGEVLVTVRGTLGGVALAPSTMAGYNVSREVAVLPIEPALSGMYLVYAIGCLWSQNWLSEQTKGVAYTGVNIEDLRLLPIPLPPLAEQHEIVRRVESLFKLADAIEKRVAAATGRAEKLTQALLARAFRGELVPTEAELARREGRDYEPASVLLERIRGDRANASSKPPKRRTASKCRR